MPEREKDIPVEKMSAAAAERPVLRISRKPDTPIRLQSEQLMQGAQKVVIVHDDSEYTLQVTRQNKLLLTK